MFNYESLFLIYDYLINERNNVFSFRTSENINYKLDVSFYYVNKIYQKNKFIDKINNTKYLLNLASINKYCYDFYDTIIVKCYYCKIPLSLNNNNTKSGKILKKNCKNIKCKNK